mgnify:CR=1 FL=1
MTAQRPNSPLPLDLTGTETFGARAALVALLSKMCWTCLSSTASLPDPTEKPYSKGTLPGACQ